MSGTEARECKKRGAKVSPAGTIVDDTTAVNTVRARVRFNNPHRKTLVYVSPVSTAAGERKKSFIPDFLRLGLVKALSLSRARARSFTA